MEFFLNYFSEEFRMTMDDILELKSSGKFRCEWCDYSTSRASQYSRHLSTDKHIWMTKGLKQDDNFELKSSKTDLEEMNSNNKYVCNCGKEYKFRQGLHKHKKTCSHKDTLENVLTPANMMELIVNIVRSNEDVKQLMVEQMKTQMEAQRQMLELVKEPRNSNSNNTTTTMTNSNNNNNSFNLNFFLNETCKDAINVSEFIENIKIEFSDVENVGKKGYVTGITDMIVRNLADLGTTKRPFHCTDTKRETIYIKDNNKWDKDTETKENFQKVLNQIYNKNWNTLRSWAQANPDIRVLDSRENILYHKILEQTDCIRGMDKLPDTNDKIIRKLSETIKVDK